MLCSIVNIFYDKKGLNNMNVRLHIYISGRVHGVFFRSEIKHEALKQNVTGWVRNLWDRRVEAVFEGEKKNVERLLEFCKIGPPLAKVIAVEISWELYKDEFQRFKII
jgi:acylphosphatase